MKEFKGTKGPWGINPKASLVVQNVDGQTICSTGNTNASKMEQQQANAHLIAAALELLESLQDSTELLNYIADVLPPGKELDTINDCIFVNNVAINKALNNI